MRVIVLILTICSAMTAWCQQAQTKRLTVSDQLAKLRSQDWTERSYAIDEIHSRPEALRSREVQAALINLLDQENREREEGCHATGKPNHDTSPLSGEVNSDSEEYGEYFASLREIVDSFATWNDPRQACILARGGYIDYPSSPVNAAIRAKAAMPCLLQMSQDECATNRAVGIPMLVEALARAKGELDSGTVQKANRIILDDLHDRDTGVRAFTVDALGKFGQTDAIPELQDIAHSDWVSEKRSDTGVQWFPIRESAAEAIAAIQKRADGKEPSQQ